MEYVEIGKLVNTQGLKGEVRVQSHTDFPEKRFKKGNVIFAFPESGAAPEELEIDGVRKHKNFIILHFKGRDSINDIEYLKPSDIKIKEQQRAREELKKGEYYVQQIVGLKVVDLAGNSIGKISEVMSMPANDVWVVKKNDGQELLMPKIDDVIKNVDLDQGVITVELMEGM